MTQSGVGGRGDGVLLPGHTNTGEAVQWDHPWGAGGVEATIADLARYATACLFPPRTPLGAAIALAQRPVIAAGDGTRQALAWIIHDGDIAEHSGATGGFSACVTVDHGRGRAVAVLASYGGSLPYVSQIKNTVRLALAGEDPRRARRPEPWPAWREDVHEAVRALLAGRAADVHARLHPRRRQTVTVGQIEQAMAGALAGADPRAAAIVHHDVAASGAVVADVAVAGPDGPRVLRIAVLPTGELGGLTILPQDRAGS